ncbi:MAG: hypothetical protein SNI45_01215 [Rikenellaceae bacterium]
MKKNFLMIAAAFALCVGATTTSCSEDAADDNIANSGSDDEESIYAGTLSGDLSADMTLEANTTWALDGGFHVPAGVTLYIEPGVTIVAQYDEANTDYIFIEQGGKIEADGGDASGVIVMTSTLEEVGAWGGIHICGYAPINTSSDSLSEIESLPYGGDDAADNSGTLRYVRVEFSGYSYSEDQECNGISCYGVGNGTTIEYVQAYHGSDDGFEFFGGTVDIKYCVATSCSDDAFDWTDGWCGRAQFIIAYQEPDVDFTCDCLLECDNQGSNNTATPASHPVIANATLVGNTYDGAKTDGVMLKAGTEIELYNSIVVGKTYSVYVKTENTHNKLVDGTSILLGNYTDTGLTNSYDDTTYSNTNFVAAGNTSDYVSTLTNNYFGTESATALDLDASFFEAVDYAGAVSADDDWTAGWVR